MKFFNIIIAVALLSTSVVVPQLSAAQKSETQRERVNLKLQNIKIEDFIKMVGKVVDKNILLSQPIPGTVNFISSSPVYKDELMDILLAVLSKKGFTIVQNGSFYTVERANTAVKRNLPIDSKGKNLMKTEFIQVENENVDIIAAKVRQFLSEMPKNEVEMTFFAPKKQILIRLEKILLRIFSVFGFITIRYLRKCFQLII